MSEEKDKMHLAELEQDVLGKPLTKLEESAMQNTIKLTIENNRLKAQVKELEEKLSEFQNGLPIEKAKTDGTVYNWHDGKSWRYVWYQLDGWTDGTFTKISEDTFFTRQQLNMFRPKIVHPLSAP